MYHIIISAYNRPRLEKQYSYKKECDRFLLQNTERKAGVRGGARPGGGLPYETDGDARRKF